MAEVCVTSERASELRDQAKSIRPSRWRSLQMGPSRSRMTALDGFVVVGFLSLTLSPWLLPATAIDLSATLAPPSLTHPLGTDNLGRDLLARLGEAIAGAVLPLWSAVLVGCCLGLVACLLSLRIIPRFPFLSHLGFGAAAIIASIPVGLASFAFAATAEEANLWTVIFPLACLFAVRIYLQVLHLYQQDHHLGFWLSHEALGGSLWDRLLHYGLRGRWSWPLADAFSFHLKASLAIEASLSYLGFGVQEPQASFGNMLASHFDLYLRGHMQILVLILAALFLTVAFPGSFTALIGGLNRQVSYGK